MARIPSGELRGHWSIALEVPLPAGKTASDAPKKHPFNVKNLFSIRGLGSILPSWPAAEFFGTQQGIGSGIRHTVTC
jgi:hypothetical protein